MRTLRTTAAFVLMALAVSMALYTGAKLYKMSAIRGWVPGAVHKERVVTDKRAVEGEYGPVYWIAWEHGDIAQRSNVRENVDEQQWSAIRVGDKVTIAYYRDDPEPYKPDGIYASTGNFVFDFFLLIGEIMLSITSVRFLRRQWKKPSPNLSLNPDAQSSGPGNPALEVIGE